MWKWWEGKGQKGGSKEGREKAGKNEKKSRDITTRNG